MNIIMIGIFVMALFMVCFLTSVFPTEKIKKFIKGLKKNEIKEIPGETEN